MKLWQTLVIRLGGFSHEWVEADQSRRSTDWQRSGSIASELVSLSFFTVGALITHAYVAVKEGSLSLLIVGLVLFPLGTIFGWMTWFEWFFYTF